MAEGRSWKQLWWVVLALIISPVLAAIFARARLGPEPPGLHRGWGKKAAAVVDGGEHDGSK